MIADFFIRVPRLTGLSMSWWILPTTADIGVRAFSSDATGVMREAALGLQSVQLSEAGAASLNSKIRSTGIWMIQAPGGDIERGLVRMLEEILYRGSVENQWLVDAAIKIDSDQISLQAVWVDSDEVEREVEVKAITLHELVLREIQSGEIIDGVEPDIPTFEGPGWMAQVVFDI